MRSGNKTRYPRKPSPLPVPEGETSSTRSHLLELKRDLERQQQQLALKEVELAKGQERQQSASLAAATLLMNEREELNRFRCRLEAEQAALQAERSHWQSYQDLDSQSRRHLVTELSPHLPTSETAQQRRLAEEKKLEQRRRALDAKRRSIKLEQQHLSDRLQEVKRAEREIQELAAKTRIENDTMRTEAMTRIREAENAFKQLEGRRRTAELQHAVCQRELLALEQAIANKRQELASFPRDMGRVPITSFQTSNTFGEVLTPRSNVAIPSETLDEREWEVAAREQACLSSEIVLQQERRLLDNLAKTLQQRVGEIEEVVRTVEAADLRQRDERGRLRQLFEDLHQQSSGARDNESLSLTSQRPKSATDLWRAQQLSAREEKIAVKERALTRQDENLQWQRELYAAAMGKREKALQRDRQAIREDRYELAIFQSTLYRQQRMVEEAAVEIQHERCVLLQQRLLLEAATATWLDSWSGNQGRRRKLLRLRKRLDHERARLKRVQQRQTQQVERSLQDLAGIQSLLQQRLDQVDRIRRSSGKRPKDCENSTNWLAQMYRQESHRWTQERLELKRTIGQLEGELDIFAAALIGPPNQSVRENKQPSQAA